MSRRHFGGLVIADCFDVIADTEEFEGVEGISEKREAGTSGGQGVAALEYCDLVAVAKKSCRGGETDNSRTNNSDANNPRLLEWCAGTAAALVA